MRRANKILGICPAASDFMDENGQIEVTSAKTVEVQPGSPLVIEIH